MAVAVVEAAATNITAGPKSYLIGEFAVPVRVAHANNGAGLPRPSRLRDRASCGGPPPARVYSAATRAAWSNGHQWELTHGE